ncbi:hypothetical protein GEV33_007049 [Tenebrio molitor]|uniref:CCHC-type domain-containing protein n=1 Tax=Tenebrio molitor TaxID=7067 RepID=A0A8J6HK11_TENMO|nr:hypothetical protein GEV33_007049 [Tenebrio molitor]
MSPGRDDDSDSSSEQSNEKCRKCRRKVLHASVKCAKCNEIYHERCFQILVGKGKKFCVITDSMMLCEEHCRQISCVEETFQRVVKELKQENLALKNENSKLITENCSLSSEIEALGMEINKLKNCDNSSELKENSTDITVIKTITDKFKADLTEYFSSLKNDINIHVSQKFNELGTGLSPSISSPKTYSEIAKQPKDVVILQPKVLQDSLSTMKNLKEQINLAEVGVGITKIKHLKNGGISVACNNADERIKLETEAKKKLGDAYSVKKTILYNPKIKIVGFSEELNEENLRNCLIQQNLSLKNISGTFKLITCKKMKKNYLAIIEVDPLTFADFMKMESVCIGWNICKVYEHVNVLRCFKCGGFNHTSEKCKEDVSKCLNCCGEGHDEKDCNNNSVCVNCLKLNKSNNLNLKVDHSRFNYSCEVYKKQVSISKSKTRYSM